MNKYLLILALSILFVKSGISQKYSYAWINDIRIGQPESGNNLGYIINNINKKPEIKFAVLTGSLTEDGTDRSFEVLKNILDSLNVPYYVIPGRDDLEYSQSAGQAFLKLFKNENFAFEYNGVEHIGLNTGIIWNHYGHVSVENLKWLDSVLNTVPADREIILYSSFPINHETDNSLEIVNRLKEKKIKEIISGDTQKNNNITEYSNIKSAVSIPSSGIKNSWNYTLVTDSPDTLLFYSVNSAKTKLWGLIKKDSAVSHYIEPPAPENFSASFKKLKIRPTILWEKNLDETLTSALCTGNNKIYITSESGRIYCVASGGNEVWKYSSSEALAGGPVNAGNNLVFGTLRGDLISLDDSTGYVVQSVGLNTPITSNLIAVKGEYSGQQTTGIVFGTSEGDLYFYEAGTFEMIWENHSAKGVINSKPLFINNRIIYPSGDGYLYCVDASSGIINWKWKIGNERSSYSSGDPVSDGRNVFFVSSDKDLYAIDLMLGRTVWKRDYDTFESIGLSQDKKNILIKSRNDYIFKVSASDGRLKQKIKADFGEDYLRNTPLTVNNNYLFCCRNGFIYLADDKGNWTKLFYAGNSPLLNIIKLNRNVFIAANKDGDVISFKLE